MEISIKRIGILSTDGVRFKEVQLYFASKSKFIFLFIFLYTAPPEEQTIRREENITIKLMYDSVFSNMLEINVYIKNHNNVPLCLTDVKLRSTCEVSSLLLWTSAVKRGLKVLLDIRGA